MKDLNHLLRANIRTLKAYSSARDEFSGEASAWLDANENPYDNGLNRYPDPHHIELREAISSEKNIPPENIFLGHGSDEIIDLLFRAFCEPGRDQVVIMPPTYGMYAVSAAIQDTNILACPLDEEFQPDLIALEQVLATAQPKLIFLCSPNNPTGNRMEAERVATIMDMAPGLVVVDEAYIDFSTGESWIKRLNRYPQLVVMQTFSKARGHAGIRLGMAFASAALVDILNRIKPPYNLSTLTQHAGLQAVRKGLPHLTAILAEREKLREALSTQKKIKKIYPSDANFLLVEVDNADELYKELLDSGLVVRNRHTAVAQTLRITVGTPAENQLLLTLLSGQKPTAKGRTARVVRRTSETDIFVQLNLDGMGRASIHSGLGFFDHMLEQLSRHGQLDLNVRVDGDLHIDEHHTIEDTALALGEAFLEALGDKKGIERYGFLLPMDESLAQVAIDFGGRPWLVWDATFKRETIGGIPTEMFQHFFKSFSDAARCNLNIQVSGENEHHMIEAIFKAFARAIKMAVRKDGSQLLPSTKGVL